VILRTTVAGDVHVVVAVNGHPVRPAKTGLAVGAVGIARNAGQPGDGGDHPVGALGCDLADRLIALFGNIQVSGVVKRFLSGKTPMVL
jgi:hypothetical protein